MRKWLLILNYARRKGIVLAWAFPLAAVSGGLALLQPWPMKVLVDNVLGASPLPPILVKTLQALSLHATRPILLKTIAILSLGLFAASRSVGALLTWISVRGCGGAVFGLGEDLFARLQRRSLAFHKKAAVGELMSQVLGDSRCAQQILEDILFNPIVALLTMIGMFVLMVKIDLKFTVIAFAVSPFTWVISALLSRRLRDSAKLNRDIEGQIQSQLQQTFAGIAVVQAFAQEEQQAGRFKRLVERHTQSQKINLLIGSLKTLGTGVVAALLSGLVLWLVARRVLDGSVSLGSALMFMAYFGILQAQLNALTNVFSVVDVASANVNRIAQVMDTPAEIVDRPNAIPLPGIRGEVEFRNVTAGYDNQRVLKGISFRVEAGQTVAIIGPTGSGKTTLVNLIQRIDDPWEGSVLVDGHNLRDAKIESLRMQIAVVLQEPVLFSCSIAENIGYGRPDATQAEIEVAAHVAHAHDFIMALPQGYRTVTGEWGATLSGGMRQRISIARAVLKDAPILILDEPSSNLDVVTEQLIVKSLLDYAKRRTTFVIAHRLSTIRQADLILVLKDGEIVECGKGGELLARGGYYAQMQDTQPDSASGSGLTT